MDTPYKKIYQFITDTVRAVEPTAKIFLYGSRARGDNRADSDWDIAVIVDNGKSRMDNTATISYPLYYGGLDLNAEINAVVFSTQQWEEGFKKSLYYHNVQREGIQL